MGCLFVFVQFNLERVKKACADQTVQVINRKSFDLKRNKKKLEGAADVSSFEKK